MYRESVLNCVLFEGKAVPGTSEYLLGRGAMVDTEDVYGSNPMHNAAGGRDECLAVLPSAGADPVAASGRGSPLLPAILYGKGLNSQLCL